MTRMTKILAEVYKPKSKDEQDFVDKHVVIKHDDRAGNKDDVFKGNTKPVKRKEERHGYESGEDEKVYESTSSRNVDPAKISTSRLADHVMGADDVSKSKDGVHTFRRGFFYRSGSTSDGHADRISNSLKELGIKHKVLDHGTQDYRPFRGGASVKSQNHHWVKIKIEPGQKVTLDEAVLNEISKDTKDRYFDKLHNTNEHPDDYELKSAWQRANGKHAEADTSARKSRNRLAGMKKVLGVHSEQTEVLDEISQKMARAYRDKARDNVRDVEDDRDYYKAHDDNTDHEDRIIRKRNTGIIRASNKINKFHKTKVHATESVEELDELSKATLGRYFNKALNSGVVASGKQYKADQSSNDIRDARNTVRKRAQGLKRASNRLTREDIINRAITNYLPEEVVTLSAEERLVETIEHLPDTQVATLLGLFETLSPDNQHIMLEKLETTEGINQMLNFAIETGVA